jgi:hypothetical protein
MYFPYGIWKDAEREAKRLPPSQDNGCGLLLTLFFGGIIIYSCFSVGGIGILIGLCIIIGMIQGLNK